MTYTFVDGEQLTAAKVNQYLVNRPNHRAKRNITVPSGTGGVNVVVTFSTPMEEIPAIELTVSHPNLTHWRVTAESKEGFTARFDRSGAGTYTFNYIAMLEA